MPKSLPASGAIAKQGGSKCAERRNLLKANACRFGHWKIDVPFLDAARSALGLLEQNVPALICEVARTRKVCDHVLLCWLVMESSSEEKHLSS